VVALAGLFASFGDLPSSASAASCPVNPGNATAWKGGSGSLHDDANWTNGTPSGACDVSITAAGDYTVTMTAGANTKSLVLGGPGSTPHLVISDESPNTNLDAQPAGITIHEGASVMLTCQLGCPGGGPDINSGASSFANAGTITVHSNTGGGAVVGGAITNTGTIAFEKTGSLSGVIVNQGAINISPGATATNTGSSCGDTGASVKNDTDGAITADGTGVLSVINYEQGNGSVGGTSLVPINIPCGSLKYAGNGASKVQATGGFNLTGEIQPGQALAVLAQSNNTNAVLQGNVTNKGSITLSCDSGGCNGGASGGAGFNVNDKDFVNAGTFTVAAASGTGANISANNEGTITNTGTMNFDQTAGFSGPITNQGAIKIANEKAVSSGGGSCSPAPSFKNDTGGSITGTGTGALFVTTYDQGNGTTTGANPVQMGGGCLKYSGNGASKVKVTGGFSLTGTMQSGQSLTVSAEGASNVNTVLQGDFTNNGSITLTCSPSPCNGPGFNGNGHFFTNAGTFTVDAAATNGSVNLDRSSGGMTNAPTGIFQFNGPTQFNGDGPFSNQGTLQIAAGVNNTPSFINAGTIVLDQSATDPFLNTGTLTNTGTIATSGASAKTSSIGGMVDQTGASAQVVVPAGTKLSINNPLLLKAGKLSGGGTIQGSVNNSGGTVLPGASPGTLAVTGNYTQGAGGKLDIEIEGTGAGQFDKLAIDGNATLGGELALQPTGGYPTSSAIGDSVDVLSYNGTRTGEFDSTTTSPPLGCPKQLTVGYDDAAKKATVAVSSTGANCGGGSGANGGGGGNGGGGAGQQSVKPAETILGGKPKKTIKTKKAKVKVSFSFSSDVAGATFECKLDKGAFTPCTSPKSYKVKLGKHTFLVRAVGPGGTDKTPASKTFKVVKKKPKKK
jgi:fibronectin-binding autotransporter adhesin